MKFLHFYALALVVLLAASDLHSFAAAQGIEVPTPTLAPTPMPTASPGGSGEPTSTAQPTPMPTPVAPTPATTDTESSAAPAPATTLPPPSQGPSPSPAPLPTGGPSLPPSPSPAAGPAPAPTVPAPTANSGLPADPANTGDGPFELFGLQIWALAIIGAFIVAACFLIIFCTCRKRAANREFKDFTNRLEPDLYPPASLRAPKTKRASSTRNVIAYAKGDPSCDPKLDSRTAAAGESHAVHTTAELQLEAGLARTRSQSPKPKRRRRSVTLPRRNSTPRPLPVDVAVAGPMPVASYQMPPPLPRRESKFSARAMYQMQKRTNTAQPVMHQHHPHQPYGSWGRASSVGPVQYYGSLRSHVGTGSTRAPRSKRPSLPRFRSFAPSSRSKSTAVRVSYEPDDLESLYSQGTRHSSRADDEQTYERQWG